MITKPDNIAPQKGHGSPWGRIQHVETLAPGIVAVETAGHGGIWVSLDRLASIPQKHRDYAARWSGSEQWYEEDCAAACIVVAFGSELPRGDVEEARACVARWIEGGASWDAHLYGIRLARGSRSAKVVRTAPGMWEVWRYDNAATSPLNLPSDATRLSYHQARRLARLWVNGANGGVA